MKSRIFVDHVQRNISNAYLIILSENCQSPMIMSRKTDINIYKAQTKSQLLDGKYPLLRKQKKTSYVSPMSNLYNGFVTERQSAVSIQRD